MKTSSLILFLLSVALISFGQSNIFPADGSVGIGTLTPDGSSVFEVQASKQGMLPPRLQEDGRNAISTPATGLFLYQTDGVPGYYYFDGSQWKLIATDGANTALSNLAATSINQDLISSADNSKDIGSSSIGWKNLHLDGGIFLNGVRTYWVTPTCTFLGTNTGILNTGNNNTFVGAGAGDANTTGGFNSFFGKDAGGGNASGTGNSFFGAGAGDVNGSGGNNSFFGRDAGGANTTSSNNSFFGRNAGLANLAGNSNSFFGESSGLSNTSGNSNAFFGRNSGKGNTTGNNNCFFGNLAGQTNNTASDNTFVGSNAGGANTSGGSNVFIGANAGGNNSSGTSNICIGANANLSALGMTNAIVIGSSINSSFNNSVILGNASTTRWGFGTNSAAGDIMAFVNTTAKLTAGGVWTNASDKNRKENFQKVDRGLILTQISQLDIQRWNYISDNYKREYIGPFSQQFHKLFGVGDDSTISTIDPAGIALVGVQALHDLVQELTVKNDELKNEIEQLKSEILIDGYVKVRTGSSESQGALLGQNIPNPFDQSTMIPFRLPSDCKDASIMIVETETSKVVAVIPITCSETHIQIDAGNLATGAYSYTLYVDGKMVDSKKLIVSR